MFCKMMGISIVKKKDVGLYHGKSLIAGFSTNQFSDNNNNNNNNIH
jgi:hypothetical protein